VLKSEATPLEKEGGCKGIRHESSPTDAAEWEHLTQVIVFLGTDTNWRHKPSVLDQMRGYKVMPPVTAQAI
jgi:hypothetical protein